jgi:UrcA family protein
MSHETTIKSRSIWTLGRLAASFLACAATMMVGQALAAAAPEYNIAVVTYGDLNLESKPGAKALYARLRNGAEDVCASLEGRDLMFKRLWQSCFDKAVGTAVARVDKPELTSLHSKTANRWKGDAVAR